MFVRVVGHNTEHYVSAQHGATIADTPTGGTTELAPHYHQ